MSRQTPAQVKDVLLEQVSRSVKELQAMLSDLSTVVDMVDGGNQHAQELCEHLDRILMHGVKEYEHGYWPVVRYFTRSEAVQMLSSLSKVTADVGRGRAWLYLALNEQAMESYVRMFIENQDVTSEHYLRDAFLRDCERLLLLQTLVSGLDFISFDLLVDSDYLDYGPTLSLSRVSLTHSNEVAPALEPRFLSAVAPATQKPPSSDSTSFSLLNILSKFGSHDNAEKSHDNAEKSHDNAEKSHDNAEKSHDNVEKSHDPASRTSDEEIDHHEETDSIPILRKHSNSMESAPAVLEQDSLQKASPQVSLLQRMQIPNSGLSRSMEEQDSGNGTVGIEDDVVVRVSKGSRQRRSKVKHRKKKSRNKDAISDAPKSAASAMADSYSKDVVDYKSELQPVDDVPIPSQSDDDVPVPTVSDGMELQPSMPEVPAQPEAEPIAELEPNYGSETRNRSNAISEVVVLQEATQFELTNQITADDVADGLSTPPLQDTVKPQPLGHTPFTTPDSLPLEQAAVKDNTELPSNQSAATPTRRRATTEEFEILSSGECEHRQHPNDRRKSPKAHFFTTPPNPELYEGLPRRPSVITEEDRHAADIRVDDNTHLVFSLDVLYSTDEKTERLIQVAMPASVGQKRNAYILISNEAVYLLRKDGIQGLYCREFGIRYSEFEYIVIGLCWQSLILVYRASGLTQRSVLLTGSEAVSRSVIDGMRSAAANCPGFKQSIPLNRDDESRIDAIERELIKLGSQTSMDIVQYSLVNWEQLSGETPPTALLDTRTKISISGWLLVKTTNLLGMSAWKQAYFQLKSGSLYQYNNEEDHVIRATYQLRDCGGCMRATGENKSYALTVLGKDGPNLVLATSNEEELTRWMQALCEAVIEREVSGPISPSHKKSFLSCAVLLTQNKIHLLLEDWRNQSVQLVTSCEVTDVNGISVDSSLPLYCTISYDHGDSQGVWLMCFNSEYELGKFERALASTWTDLFQIILPFSEVHDPLVKERAHKAVELMQFSRYRSDSITRGRTDFSFSAMF